MNGLTEDLDFFGRRGRSNVASARFQLEAAAAERGWTTVCLQESASFVRLRLQGPDELLIDIAIDVSPGHPPVVSVVGPTFDPEELAGRKMTALFDRAESRDFADIFVLARRFSRELLLARAAEIDLGLDLAVLATMMRTIDRFTDDELSLDTEDVAAMRACFRDWADKLG